MTTTDDDAAPGVTLALAPPSIAEAGGVSTGDGDALAPVERGDDGGGLGRAGGPGGGGATSR